MRKYSNCCVRVLDRQVTSWSLKFRGLLLRHTHQDRSGSQVGVRMIGLLSCFLSSLFVLLYIPVSAKISDTTYALHSYLVTWQHSMWFSNLSCGVPVVFDVNQSFNSLFVRVNAESRLALRKNGAIGQPGTERKFIRN